ncbi:hypothetical protein [Burkholderia phage BCSR5]|nr:hypothetical protein [Burkholderia phage BCSR5]
MDDVVKANLEVMVDSVLSNTSGDLRKRMLLLAQLAYEEGRKEEVRRSSMPRTTRAKIAEVTSKSWQDPAVSAARRVRHNIHVEYDGMKMTFKSVRVAFEKLHLPEVKHQRFRLELKRDGKRSIDWNGITYNFTLGEQR